MWTIIKFDKKKIKLLEADLRKNLGQKCIFYTPRVKIESFKKNKRITKEINILGDYFFCFHENLKKKNTINQLKFLRGLKYFLNGCIEFQEEIKNFVNRCKKLENEKGFITKDLFDVQINNEYRFSTGPFVGKIFKILNLQKDKMNIMMGNINTSLKKKDYLFNPL